MVRYHGSYVDYWDAEESERNLWSNYDNQLASPRGGIGPNASRWYGGQQDLSPAISVTIVCFDMTDNVKGGDSNALLIVLFKGFFFSGLFLR